MVDGRLDDIEGKLTIDDGNGVEVDVNPYA